MIQFTYRSAWPHHQWISLNMHLDLNQTLCVLLSNFVCQYDYYCLLYSIVLAIDLVHLVHSFKTLLIHTHTHTIQIQPTRLLWWRNEWCTDQCVCKRIYMWFHVNPNKNTERQITMWWKYIYCVLPLLQMYLVWLFRCRHVVFNVLLNLKMLRPSTESEI